MSLDESGKNRKNASDEDIQLQALENAMAKGEERRRKFQKALAEGDSDYIIGLVQEASERCRKEYNMLMQNPWRNDL